VSLSRALCVLDRAPLTIYQDTGPHENDGAAILATSLTATANSVPLSAPMQTAHCSSALRPGHGRACCLDASYYICY
jgi:hypothetical protein